MSGRLGLLPREPVRWCMNQIQLWPRKNAICNFRPSSLHMGSTTQFCGLVCGCTPSLRRYSVDDFQLSEVMKPGNPKKPKTVKAASGRAKTKKAPPIPPILLEGDTTPAPAASGPGRRYATPPVSQAAAAPPPPAAQLPEAYGTRKLLLTARDPHWLYAHWDLTAEQLKDYNKKSTDGHLLLRIYR